MCEFGVELIYSDEIIIQFSMKKMNFSQMYIISMKNKFRNFF